MKLHAILRRYLVLDFYRQFRIISPSIVISPLLSLL